MELLINNRQEMISLAKKIAGLSKKSDIIGLCGTLGAGKSFFASSFINHLLEESTTVLSPTFNLVYCYPTNKGEVFHFDLYRIKNENELENIGIEEAIINGISLIEWPDIAEKYLRKNYLEITIKFGQSESARLVTLKFDNSWQSRLISLLT